MICWLLRWQTLYHEGTLQSRRALNAAFRSYSSETALPKRAANTQGYHALKRASPRAKAPLLSPERSTRARHTLRALLRECSYLPDPAARQYLTQHILSRFRTYGHRAWKHRNDPDYEVRLDEKEREARRSLNQLKKANDGELKPLLKVLFMTYGRIGKRRYELMQPLMPKAASEEMKKAIEEVTGTLVGQDEAEVVAGVGTQDTVMADAEGYLSDIHQQSEENPLTGHATPATNIQKALPQLTPELYALLRSHIRTSPATMSRPNPRSLKPDIPKLNAKMRPMPKSRVKNMTKKWYANTLHRLLPPLPTQEWLKLQELAAGHGIQEQLAKRRTRPTNPSDGQMSALDRILTRGTFDMRSPTTTDAHTLTPRFMRRVYAAVFSQCPRVDWDAKKERWSVSFGSQTLSRSQPIQPP